MIDSNKTLEVGTCLLNAHHICVLSRDNAAENKGNLGKFHTQRMVPRA